ncbi:MAG: UDP-2,4-diacetamido-2,4,6-trideoxy-beta-L-altropyranose hydrolase [Sarcina sp.]
MKCYIIANGGEKLGMGHIMRTLVLAKALKNNVEVIYVITNKQEFNIAMKKVSSEDFSYVFEDELTGKLTKNDLLIIDRYDLSSEDISTYRKLVKKLLVIDDNNILDFYDCDFILNQNLHAKTLNYNLSSTTKLLLGGGYTLLRKEFLNNEPIQIKKDISSVLLTVGGSDNLNFTHTLLKEIKHFNSTINVVLGPAFKFNEELKSEYRKYENIIFHENANMLELMKSSDIAISACGTTIYELAYLGVPTIGLVIVENQAKIGAFLNSEKIAIISEVHNMKDSLESLREQRLRKVLHERMIGLVDGHGVKRIINELLM